MSPTPPMTPPTLRIICTSLGLEAADLETIFGIAHRTATRWLSNLPAPRPVQDQIRVFQSAVSATIEAVLTDIDTALGPHPEHQVIFTRYPVQDLMPEAESDEQIWLRNPRTWDAMLGRLINTLTDQGITAHVVTVTTPQPLWRLSPVS